MAQKYEIHDRIFQFVVNGLKLPRFIPNTVESKIILNQYIRSLTSVGANDNEADGAASKKDFIHCYAIVRKELKETCYWLRVLVELFPAQETYIRPLIQESEELIRIISSIISNTTKHP